MNLQDEQLSQIKEIAFTLEEGNLVLKNENRKLFLSLKKLLDQDQPDYAAIEDNIRKRADNRAKIFVAGLKARKKITGLLTEEQKQMIAQARREWVRERFQSRNRLQSLPSNPIIIDRL